MRRCTVSVLSVTICGLLGPLTVEAGSGLALTEEVISFVSQADPEAGKDFAQKKCIRCHGLDGISKDAATPHISGLSALYHYKQLKDFQSGDRYAPRLMRRSCQNVTDQDLANVAAWYAGQPTIPTVNTVNPPDLVRNGDPQRGILACAACHGQNGQGMPPHIPGLAAQHAEYLTVIMERYRDGTMPTGDPVMLQSVMAMTGEETDQVAEYYQRLGGR